MKYATVITAAHKNVTWAAIKVVLAGATPEVVVTSLPRN